MTVAMYEDRIGMLERTVPPLKGEIQELTIREQNAMLVVKASNIQN